VRGVGGGDTPFTLMGGLRYGRESWRPVGGVSFGCVC
jgi:hypothetical protein